MTEPDSRFDFVNALARETGDMLVQFAANTSLTPSFKADQSIVTQADKTADRLIHNAIQKSFPGEPVLSEELQPELPSYLNLSENYTWIIDPLDGTTNFSLRLPYWGVSIACLKNGDPFIGAIYFPLLGELYSAQKGVGAYLNHNLIQSDDAHLYQQISFFSCCSRTYKQYKVTVPYKTRIFGSTCYSLCSVAKGISILGFEATPKIWDIAAGWLVVKEAGKEIEILNNGSPFPVKPNCDYSTINFPTIAGSTDKILARGKDQIIPINP